MSEGLPALHDSVEHLRQLVGRLEPDQLRQPAYPDGWTVADVLSHLGSGAVILRRGLDDVVSGRKRSADVNQSVWDEWNAKVPDAQAADALVADAELLAALDALDAEQRRGLRFPMGPMDLDFAGLVGLRLNEHVLHTWDIEVVLTPGVGLPDRAARAVVDNLELIARFAGKPTGTEQTVHVRTSDPERRFTLEFGTDSLELIRTDGTTVPDLELPAEAFVRLVYGRLDLDHTPPGIGGAVLEELRAVFPGL
ncbi:MAG: maleylpyruvate isomerase family mycothiol-dependent enzyme [Acidimicrobiales bacterium]